MLSNINLLFTIIIVLVTVPVISLFYHKEFPVPFIRGFSFYLQSVLLLLALVMYAAADFTQKFAYKLFSITILNVESVIAVEADGISAAFIVLTIFIIWLCFLWLFEEKLYNAYSYYTCIWLTQLLLLIAFSTKDLIIFYIFFEGTLIPLFILIGIWGSRRRKIKASMYFFLFTLIGSGILLYAILEISYLCKSSHYDYLKYVVLPNNYATYLWRLFFIGFAVKLPIIPFHLWLPEAHVEAPTVGSVILAALVLKLGGFGIIRFMLPIFKEHNLRLFPYIGGILLISVFYSSFIALRQTNIKKIIAYSSIAHMSLSLSGLFSNTFEGLKGAILLMIGHGIVSAGLFFIIGSLQRRVKTQVLMHFEGMLQRMPIFGFLFFVLTLFNVSFPLTVNFAGELLCLEGCFTRSFVVTVFLGISMILSVCYSIILFNKIFFGRTRYVKRIYDISLSEAIVFVVIVFLGISLGINPEFFMDVIKTPIEQELYWAPSYPLFSGDLVIELLSEKILAEYKRATHPELFIDKHDKKFDSRRRK